jgi:hypothetical protein
MFCREIKLEQPFLITADPRGGENKKQAMAHNGRRLFFAGIMNNNTCNKNSRYILSCQQLIPGPDNNYFRRIVMKLIININDNKVRAILAEKGKNIDEKGFDLDNNLSEKLLPTVDKVLKRHKLEPKDLKKAELECNVPDSYTTYRIAKAVADALNWK